MPARARSLGTVLRDRLDALVGHGVVAVRTAGPWAGIDLDPGIATGRQACEALARRGVLVKDTHGSTVRMSPPLVATAEEVGVAVGALADALVELRGPDGPR